MAVDHAAELSPDKKKLVGEPPVLIDDKVVTRASGFQPMKGFLELSISIREFA